MKSNWTVRNTYLYLVCLITLVIVIFTTVGTVRGLVSLAYPEPVQVVTSAETEKGIMEADVMLQRRWSQRYAILDLVRNVSLLAIAAPLYVSHWRRIERA
ncbi:MAG: hypothetical protein ACYCYF_07695 [Anaerolineae bacterium]